MERFDGAAAWATLDEESQAKIGAIALELVVAWHGIENNSSDMLDRLHDAAETALNGLLVDAVSQASTALAELLDAFDPPVPSLLGPICRVCGCSDHFPCLPVPCAWAEDDLCTACVGKEATHG